MSERKTARPDCGMRNTTSSAFAFHFSPATVVNSRASPRSSAAAASSRVPSASPIQAAPGRAAGGRRKAGLNTTATTRRMGTSTRPRSPLIATLSPESDSISPATSSPLSRSSRSARPLSPAMRSSMASRSCGRAGVRKTMPASKSSGRLSGPSRGEITERRVLSAPVTAAANRPPSASTTIGPLRSSAGWPQATRSSAASDR